MSANSETLRQRQTAADRSPLESHRRIAGLTAQVDDLKYTLHVVLQCLVADQKKLVRDERYKALVKDARAALNAKETDYLV